MRSKLRNEELFCRFSHTKLEPTENGRQQFFKEQSLGIKPQTPDPYYLALVEGKTAFDFLCKEYEGLYLSGEWWGFLQLWKDWEGERWTLPYLCKWYRKVTSRQIPEWLSLEISEQELKDKYLLPEMRLAFGLC